MTLSLKQKRLLQVKVGMIVLLLLAGCVIAIVKAGILQLKKGEALSELSQRQSKRAVVYEGPRGAIYDRSAFLLAESVGMNSVYAEPVHVKAKEKTARLLSPILEISYANLLQKLSQKRSFTWLVRRITPDKTEKIKKLRLKGIGLVEEEKRFYPGHTLLAQFLGSVSVDGKAQGGIEQSFDPYLRGKNINTVAYVDARGAPVRPRQVPSTANLSGADVYLTIDARLQSLAEEVLKRAMLNTGAKAAWAIVMRPDTGDILALANLPQANLNEAHTSSLESRRNLALAESFEPGSTFKLLTLAAGLEAGVVNPESRIYCENGEMKVGNFKIRDVSKKEWLTASEVLKYSSNIGVYKIAERVGKERIYNLLQAFGFGSFAGLGLMEEAKGRVSLPNKWGLSRFANISFGYGLMVTSVQLVSMAATVANGGVKIEPQIIKQIVKSDGSLVYEPQRKEGVRVLSEKSAKTLMQMMVHVTEEGGTGSRAHIEGVKVAGKSGTTEKLDPKTRRYDKAKNYSSFLGFAPAEKPEIAAIVVIDEPKGIAYGGRIAAPAWHEIVEYALIVGDGV